MKKSYVPTTLGQYLNENKSITLTRKYGEKQPVVVGSRAPMRNAVLSYVAENAKVSRVNLKRFIAGLNETSKNPAAAANMWLKRNQRFFESTTAGGVTTYKLSKLGEKLVNVIQPQTTGALSEETKIKSKLNEKDHDFKDEKSGEKGINDEDESVEEGKECNEEETREDRVKRIVEQIKAKRAAALNESDDEDDEDKEEDKDEDKEEDHDESTETPEEEAAETDEEQAKEDEEGTEEHGEDDEVVADDEVAEDDDRVEITEFIITVDDVNDAIAELGELGVEAEVATDELGGGEDLPDDMDMEIGDEDLGGEEDLGGDEELPDFDLDLGGELEGEGEEVAEEVPEVEESITGGENFERKVAKQNHKTTPNLVEDDDEFEMGDLDSFDPEADIEGEEETIEELPIDTPEDQDDELDIAAGEEIDAEAGEEVAAGTQIKVSAENWDVLKGWLEGKGVDIEDMFGGEIEVEGEEGIEDEISFDGLEDTGEEKGGEDVELDDEEGEEKGDDDDEEEEVEESVTGMEKEEKAQTPNLTK